MVRELLIEQHVASNSIAAVDVVFLRNAETDWEKNLKLL